MEKGTQIAKSGNGWMAGCGDIKTGKMALEKMKIVSGYLVGFPPGWNTIVLSNTHSSVGALLK